MKTVKIGFLGMGNVGSGAYAILKNNAPLIEEREGLRIIVKRALVRSLNKARPNEIETDILTTNPQDVLNDPEIEIIAEFLGGKEPAREYMLQALKNGKTVVTANKVALSQCWPELEECAREHNAGLYFEASAAGGIPIIRTLISSMQANDIDRIMGIINGTTNYILSAMSKDGRDYAPVLADAQRLGLAEPDPTLDVEGMDAAFKLSILSSLAFHTRVPVDKVYVEGITNIAGADIRLGQEFGLVLKLLAIGKKQDGHIEVRVHPTFIPEEHPLASIDGATNAVFIRGNAVGELMLSGQGAGGLPTGSAVVSDIIYAAHQDAHQYTTFPNIEQSQASFSYNWETGFYVRLTCPDRPGVLAAIAGVFARYGVSIASMVQKPASNDDGVPLIFLTHSSKELSLKQAAEELAKLDQVKVNSIIRVER
ncbi:MAG TPA: homoserine dehydrogenase [Firmicutes bacterium]|nr:homoserine dehydrogenase [Bacillota bacterium]